MELKQQILEIDGEKIFCETFIREDTVIILHGAGASSRKRFQALAQAIIRRGIGVVLFDFSSHGDSTGERNELSLERRARQAEMVIETFVPREGKIYLAGFSMSGQTVCDLLPLYKKRAPAILLGCPAVYPKEASHLLFDGGAFTTKIRDKDNWKSSPAFSELSTYEGRTVIAVGKEDEIIPDEVIATLAKSAQHLRYVEYEGVDHQLAVWLAAHEQEQEKLLDLLLN